MWHVKRDSANVWHVTRDSANMWHFLSLWNVYNITLTVQLLCFMVCENLFSSGVGSKQMDESSEEVSNWALKHVLSYSNSNIH